MSSRVVWASRQTDCQTHRHTLSDTQTVRQADAQTHTCRPSCSVCHLTECPTHFLVLLLETHVLTYLPHLPLPLPPSLTPSLFFLSLSLPPSLPPFFLPLCLPLSPSLSLLQLLTHSLSSLWRPKEGAMLLTTSCTARYHLVWAGESWEGGRGGGEGGGGRGRTRGEHTLSLLSWSLTGLPSHLYPW